MKRFASALESEVKRITAVDKRHLLRAFAGLRDKVDALAAAVNGRGNEGSSRIFAPGAIRALTRFLELQSQHEGRGTAPRAAAVLKAKGAQLPAPTPKAMRQARGDMRAVEFARELGVSPASIYSWEAGKTKPAQPFRALYAKLTKKADAGTAKPKTKPATKTKTKPTPKAQAKPQNLDEAVSVAMAS